MPRETFPGQTPLQLSSVAHTRTFRPQQLLNKSQSAKQINLQSTLYMLHATSFSQQSDQYCYTHISVDTLHYSVSSQISSQATVPHTPHTFCLYYVPLAVNILHSTSFSQQPDQYCYTHISHILPVLRAISRVLLDIRQHFSTTEI